MPGAPRYFESNAARQRAYRQRKQEGTTAELEEARDTTFWAYVVQAAVVAARQSGDALAAQVHHADAFETLRAVADHFYDRAGTAPHERPWGDRTSTTTRESLPAAPDSGGGGTHLR